MRSQETTTQSLTRELKEEAGLDLIKKSIKPHQLNVYSKPTRDSYNFDKNLPFGSHKQNYFPSISCHASKRIQPNIGHRCN